MGDYPAAVEDNYVVREGDEFNYTSPLANLSEHSYLLRDTLPELMARTTVRCSRRHMPSGPKTHSKTARPVVSSSPERTLSSIRNSFFAYSARHKASSLSAHLLSQPEKSQTELTILFCWPPLKLLPPAVMTVPSPCFICEKSCSSIHASTTLS